MENLLETYKLPFDFPAGSQFHIKHWISSVSVFSIIISLHFITCLQLNVSDCAFHSSADNVDGENESEHNRWSTRENDQNEKK